MSKQYKSASIGTLHKEEGPSANIVKNSRNFVDTFRTESNATVCYRISDIVTKARPPAPPPWRRYPGVAQLGPEQATENL